jgi:hypothetical protein
MRGRSPFTAVIAASFAEYCSPRPGRHRMQRMLRARNLLTLAAFDAVMPRTMRRAALLRHRMSNLRLVRLTVDIAARDRPLPPLSSYIAFMMSGSPRPGHGWATFSTPDQQPDPVVGGDVQRLRNTFISRPVRLSLNYEGDAILAEFAAAFLLVAEARCLP